MISKMIRVRRRRILIDVNAQRDLLVAEGSACVRNHRRVLAHIRRMMAWARKRNIPVISICQIYPNDNNGQTNCCIEGTKGQQKIPYTLLSKRVSLPADNSTDLPRDILRRHRQIVLQNRCADPFDEPRIDRLLSELRAAEFVLIGASAEDAVQAVVLGLLQRGKRVSVVTDAVGSHNKRQAELSLRKMKAKGAKLVETKRLAGTSHLRYVWTCSCKICHPQPRKTAAEVTAGY